MVDMTCREFLEYVDLDRERIWCPGCTIGLMFKQIAKALTELKIEKKDVVAVSGIGCTGRTAGYCSFDSVHTLHGRAISVAEGIKLANPNLNVLVISGDGDLIGIGGNHLLHAARRNTNITVICNNNEIYGLTGGQVSPETQTGMETITTPYGNPYSQINVLGVLKSNKKFFYARTTPMHLEHLKNVVKKAITWNGFAFVEVKSYCIENSGRRQGFKNSYDMLQTLKKYKIVGEKDDLNDDEIGIVKKE